jgi:hypothetical protein
MKKLGLLLLMQFAFLFAIAQQTTYLTQAFVTVPPTGWTIDAQSGNWSASASTNAGGTSPECHFTYTPTFTGDSHLITPNINTTGATTLFISFKHALSHYTTPYTVGVATRSNAGAWTTVWSLAPTTSVAATPVLIQVSNADVGSATFQMCFFFSGYSYNINDWWIDDLVVFQPYSVDAKMDAVTVPSYLAQGNVNVTGSVINYGTSNITSLELNYKINSGTTNTTTVSSINIAPGASYSYTCTQPWAATPGNYTVTTWISAVNGATPDPCPANDTLTKAVAVATQSTTRLPLYEEFSSSTCSPCASFSSSTFVPFETAHGTEFSLVKYQMNWPAETGFPNGDPYYTTEGGTRRTYYGVNGVPDLFIDGANSTMTSGGMVSELAAEAAKSTFFVITTAPTYTGTTATIPITINPYITGSFKVYAVVVEKTTTGNVGTNGETSWSHVMMKMLPNGSGTVVSFTAGTPYTHTYTQDLSTTHVEQMSDLQAVVFVQENTTKEVFQSANADILLTGIEEINSFGSLSVYPNPVSDFSNINLNLNSSVNVSYKVYNLLGDVVYSEDAGILASGNHSLGFNVKNLTSGMYFISLQIGDKKITRKITVNR